MMMMMMMKQLCFAIQARSFSWWCATSKRWMACLRAASPASTVAGAKESRITEVRFVRKPAISIFWHTFQVYSQRTDKLLQHSWAVDWGLLAMIFTSKHRCKHVRSPFPRVLLGLVLSGLALGNIWRASCLAKQTRGVHECPISLQGLCVTGYWYSGRRHKVPLPGRLDKPRSIDLSS